MLVSCRSDVPFDAVLTLGAGTKRMTHVIAALLIENGIYRFLIIVSDSLNMAEGRNVG